MRIVGYAILALAALAMDVEAIENEAPKTASAEAVAWEIAWSVAMFEHRESVARSEAQKERWEKLSHTEKMREAIRGGRSEFRSGRRSRRRDPSDAREIYGDAWAIFKRARAIYEADGDGHVAAAGENHLFALQIYEHSRLKYDAAIKAEIAARNAAAGAARAIYEPGRERNITAWEDYQAVLKIHDDARTKLNAAYDAEKAARRAVMGAVSEARRAARNALEKANRGTGGR